MTNAKDNAKHTPFKVTIRKDLKLFRVPVGNGYSGRQRTFKARWIGATFQVYHRGKWQIAESVDFEHGK
jgi:hypothetical protein